MFAKGDQNLYYASDGVLMGVGCFGVCSFVYIFFVYLFSFLDRAVTKVLAKGESKPL